MTSQRTPRIGINTHMFRREIRDFPGLSEEGDCRRPVSAFAQVVDPRHARVRVLREELVHVHPVHTLLSKHHSEFTWGRA
jgi:hypothetical protein